MNTETLEVTEHEALHYITYILEQNGLTERMIAWQDLIRILIDANLSNTFQGEAIMILGYLQNWLPTKATEKTLYEWWNGMNLNIGL